MVKDQVHKFSPNEVVTESHYSIPVGKEFEVLVTETAHWLFEAILFDPENNIVMKKVYAPDYAIFEFIKVAEQYVKELV